MEDSSPVQNVWMYRRLEELKNEQCQCVGTTFGKGW